MKKKTVNKDVFSKRLSLLMEEHNETTYSMADRFSLSSPTISRYMTGQMAAKITTIELMAKYFNVNPVWLMGYDVDRTMPHTLLSTSLTKHENDVLTAYRNKPETQPFVDRLLGVTSQPDHLMPIAAHNNTPQSKEEQALMQEDLDEL